jgi:hypothetical protein
LLAATATENRRMIGRAVREGEAALVVRRLLEAAAPAVPIAIEGADVDAPQQTRSAEGEDIAWLLLSCFFSRKREEEWRRQSKSKPRGEKKS